MSEHPDMTTLTILRDLQLRRGTGAVQSAFPALPIGAINELAELPVYELESGCENIAKKLKLKLNHGPQAILSSIKKAEAKKTNLDVEIEWIKHYYHEGVAAGRCTTSEVADLDYVSADKAFNDSQIMRLAKLGFYPRMIYTVPVSDKTKEGKRTSPMVFAKSLVLKTLDKKRLMEEFGCEKVLIDDDWPTKSGKSLGSMHHRSIEELDSGTRIEQQREGSLVITAMYLAEGKNALDSAFTLMRGANVFIKYKRLRKLLDSDVVRESWDANNVFGLINELQQMNGTGGRRAINCECLKCGVPFFAIEEPKCPFCFNEQLTKMRVDFS